ncbi:MAG TPA: cyanoexosortase A [Oculatellaceae cyanobacterium]|jgi:cyanoexosortase A
MALIQDFKFWLLGITGGLIGLHLRLTWVMTQSIDQVIFNLIFWIAAFSLLWKRRNTLKLESTAISTFFGLLLIGWMLIKSTNIYSNTDILILFFPLITALGLALIASGVKGFKQYKKELWIIFLLTIPKVTLAEIIDKTIGSTLIAAKFTNFLLWYLGFPVQRQGVYVFLPTGSIEVYPGCSGLNLMLLLLQIAILAIMIFDLKLYQKILLPIIGILLAFVLNGFRITLLAILVAGSQEQAFQYWHGDEGTQIFSTLSILIFGWFCHVLVQHYENQPKKQLTSQNSVEL